MFQNMEFHLLYIHVNIFHWGFCGILLVECNLGCSHCILVPPRMYEIAFQMFDLNGDGEVSPEEFDKVSVFSIRPDLTSTITVSLVYPR